MTNIPVFAPIQPVREEYYTWHLAGSARYPLQGIAPAIIRAGFAVKSMREYVGEYSAERDHIEFVPEIDKASMFTSIEQAEELFGLFRARGVKTVRIVECASAWVDYCQRRIIRRTSYGTTFGSHTREDIFDIIERLYGPHFNKERVLPLQLFETLDDAFYNALYRALANIPDEPLNLDALRDVQL